MKKEALPFIFFVYVFGCTPKQQVKTSQNMLKEAVGVINKDSTAHPKITFIEKNNAPNIIVAGKPVVRPNPNSEGLGTPYFTNYSTEQGLALNTIWCGFTDRNGNMWFGTDGGGVSRYDGKSFTNFTTTQGLAGVVVFTIAEDKKGKLWFGTEGGVSCYDGKSFTNFTTKDGLANNVVYNITEDKNGNLWFGTDAKGVSRFDGKSFTNFTTTEGLVANYVFNITEDKSGKLWFGTGGGVSRYDGKSFTNFTTEQGLADNSVISITEDTTGKLWFGTGGGGVSCYDGKSFTNFTTADGLANNFVYSITKDKTGKLWFGTRGGGLSCYNGKLFTNFTTVQGLASNIVRDIKEDKSGNLWICTVEGLSRFEGNCFTHFTDAQGLPGNFVRNIREDKKGKLWFGTTQGGVSCFDGKSFSSFTMTQGLANNAVYSIAEDRTGNLWFGTAGGGVSRYDGRSFTNFTTTQGLADNHVFNIMEDKKGNLWFGTRKGVSRFDGRSFANFTTAQGLANNNVLFIMEDKKGLLWFATNGGVSCYDGETFTNFTIAQGLAENKVRNITEDKMGNLWFGTLGGGLSRYDGKSFINFTTAQGLTDNNVWALVIDLQDNLFIGNNFGNIVLKGFKHLSPSSSANPEIIPAVNNQDNEELKNYQPVFELYSKETGYPVKDPLPNAMFVDSKGIIWEGGLTLLRFDYNALLKNTEPPKVFIQAVKIHEENIGWNNLKKKGKTNPELDSLIILNEEINSFGRELSGLERDSMNRKYSDITFDSINHFYPVPQNLVLPFEHNSISFDFIAIEPARNFLVRYQYILEGYDKDWNPVGNKTNATFGNLYEGKYVFKLRAQTPYSHWSYPIAYTFKVLPPWYRTWWAYGLYILVFSIALWGFVKWRVRAVQKEKKILEEKVIVRTKELKQSLEERYLLSKTIESQQALLNERLRISRELHDDIGSTLGSISIYSEVAINKTEKNENSREVLSKIGVASREIIDKMSDIVWSLSPNNDNFEQLQNRMVAFAALILTPRNILYDFSADEVLKEMRLTSEHRKNIFLIFKETLYNTVKYADCSKVSITLTIQNNDLTMIIQDNGKGFDVSQATNNKLIPAGEYVGGNGIKNMYARADDMNASLYIHSKKDEGTTVQLYVSL